MLLLLMLILRLILRIYFNSILNVFISTSIIMFCFDQYDNFLCIMNYTYSANEDHQAHLSCHVFLLSLSQLDEEAHAQRLAGRGMVHLLGHGLRHGRQFRYPPVHYRIRQLGQ